MPPKTKAKVVLVSADTRHQRQIQQALFEDQVFTLVNLSDTWMRTYAPLLIVVDLCQPETADAAFWVELHLAHPGARYVVITETNVSEAALSAALHAGVYCYLTWADPPQKFFQALYAVQRGERFYASPALIVSVTRLTKRWANSIRVGVLEINLETRRVRCGGQAINLTPIEWGLLAQLAQHLGQPVPSQDLLRVIWQIDPQHGTAAQLKNSILRLRKKIEPDPKHPHYILTSRGQGYYLARSVESDGTEN